MALAKAIQMFWQQRQINPLTRTYYSNNDGEMEEEHILEMKVLKRKLLAERGSSLTNSPCEQTCLLLEVFSYKFLVRRRMRNACVWISW